jgi:hypothetical protein
MMRVQAYWYTIDIEANFCPAYRLKQARGLKRRKMLAHFSSAFTFFFSWTAMLLALRFYCVFAIRLLRH